MAQITAVVHVDVAIFIPPVRLDATVCRLGMIHVEKQSVITVKNPLLVIPVVLGFRAEDLGAEEEAEVEAEVEVVRRLRRERRR